MKWTASIRPGMLGAIALAAALSFVGQPQAAAAQVAECRCFDRDGNELENCSCLRTLGTADAPFSLFLSPRRSQIGVSITYDQDREVEARGARIEEVSDGPAREAGLMEGDIVVRVDGRSVLEPLDEEERERSLDLDQSIPVQRFVALVGALEPGEAVEFEVLRDGRMRTIEITPEPYRGISFMDGEGGFGVRLGELPLARFNFQDGEMLDEMRRLEQEMGERLGAIWRRGDGDDERANLEFRLRDGEREGNNFTLGSGDGGILRLFGEGGDGAFAFGGDPCVVRRDRGENTFEVMVGLTGCTDGVELTDMNEGLASYFGTSDGVLVTEVHDGSALGLEAGDVILAIDGRSISDKEEVTRVLRSYDLDDEMTIRIRRDNREMEILGQRRGGGDG